MTEKKETTQGGATIATALLAAQRVYPPLALDGVNPHYGSSYVSLGGLIDTVLPILNEQGVVLVQEPGWRDGSPVLVTRLIHAESGEQRSASTPLYMGKQDAQAHGSAITYARRYALMSMLGLVGDEDDDGNAATAREESMGQASQRQAREERREFDPGRDLLPGAIRVTTEEDAVSVRQGQRDLAPDEDWPAVETYLSESLFGVPYDALDNPQKREFWTRLANAGIRAQDLAGPGDFPPPSFENVEEAYAWAFKGVTIALRRPETPSEEEAEPDASPSEEPAEEPTEEAEPDNEPPGGTGPSDEGMG